MYMYILLKYTYPGTCKWNLIAVKSLYMYASTCPYMLLRRTVYMYVIRSQKDMTELQVAEWKAAEQVSLLTE